MEKLTSLVGQYQQQWRANPNFLFLGDTIRLCQYNPTLDDETDNIIRSKYNNLLARLTLQI